MPLPLLDIFAFSFIFEPLLYLLLPNLAGRLTGTGRAVQKVGLIFFGLSMVSIISFLISGNGRFGYLFIIFFVVSYISGFICLFVDPERNNDKKNAKLETDN